MDTPPPQEMPEEEVKSRITNLWWLENELRALEMRAQKVLAPALTLGTQNMESVRTHGYAQMKDEKVAMIRMQKGMAVSKAGTEALAVAGAVIHAVHQNTDECWKEKMSHTGVEREELGHEGGMARAGELAEAAAAGSREGVCGDGSAKRGEKCL
jgi:hypothetical protein